MPGERWLPVPGLEGMYEVSSDGAIRSLDRCCTGKDGRSELHRGKMLRPYRMGTGYIGVTLCGRRRTVHAIVAETFLGPRPERADVMHINGDRTDNRASNLRYGTRSENLRSTYAYGGRQANGKLSLDDVRCIRARLANNDSAVQIAKDFGVNSAAVYHIKNGTAFGWYKEDN